MRASQAAHPGLKLPPPIFVDMNAEIVGSDARSLRVRFPVLERYQNPVGHMQGGMIVTAMDNTMGPLAYALAPPSATLTLTTDFIRPVTAEDRHILVVARLEDQTKRFLYLSAEAMNEAGDVLARCTSTMMIVGRRRSS